MKKQRNSLTKRIFGKDKSKKIPKELTDNWYDEAMDALTQSLEEEEEREKESEEVYRRSLNNYVRVKHIKDRVEDGYYPNELESSLIGLLRI